MGASFKPQSLSVLHPGGYALFQYLFALATTHAQMVVMGAEYDGAIGPTVYMRTEVVAPDCVALGRAHHKRPKGGRDALVTQLTHDVHGCAEFVHAPGCTAFKCVSGQVVDMGRHTAHQILPIQVIRADQEKSLKQEKPPRQSEWLFFRTCSQLRKYQSPL